MKMLRRLVSLMMALSLALSLLPMAAQAEDKQYAYTSTSDVMFRPRMGGSDYISRLPQGWVLEVVAETTKGSVAYYQVKGSTPENPNQTKTGYIVAQYMVKMTAEEQAAWLANPQQPMQSAAAPTAAPAQQPTAAPGASSGEAKGYIRLTQDKVNLRRTPAGDSLTESDAEKLPLGQVLIFYGEESAQGYNWALVSYNGKLGYVRSDCYGYSDVAGNLLAAPGGVATAAPTAAPTAPSVPAAPTAAPALGEGVYGRTTADKVMFRKTMNTSGDFWARLPQGWTLEVLGSQVKGTTLWYKVRGGTPANPGRTYTGYIHGGYFTVTGAAATATPAPAGDSSYALIVVNGANLRQTPGGAALTAYVSGTVVNVILKPYDNWYYIELNGLYGYVEAASVRILSQSELGGYTLPPAPSGAAPTAAPTPAQSGTGYVRLTLDKVNIRKAPGGTVLTAADYEKLPLGLVLAYSEGPTEVISGYRWVKITYAGKTGYIRSDCYAFCDKDGNLVTDPVVPTSTPAPGPTAAPGVSYIRLTKGGVNLRVSPWGKTLGQLNKGTVLPCYGTQYSSSDGSSWYQVYSSQLGANGFILSTMAVACGADGGDITVTPAPTTPAGTETPSTTTGYVATLYSSVWLRSAPAANAATAGKVAAKGTVVPVVGTAVQNGLYTWYPVQLSDGTRGYLRGDCVFQLAQWQLEYYKKNGVCPTPTPAPATPKPGNSEYIITTSSGLWVRKTPSTKAETLGKLGQNTVLRFYQKKTVGSVTWYKIQLNGKEYGWVHGGYVRVMTNAEYEAWRGTLPTATPAPTPSALPDPSTLSDLALTTAGRVKLRATGSMSGRELKLVYTAGTKLTYLGKYTAPTVDNNYYWFNVQYNGTSGWMRGDYVRILTAEEKKLYDLTGDPDAPKEASYSTLSMGSVGEDVRKLQQALADQGYLAASEISGAYLTSTENAVIAFQKAKGLVVDGIAGEKTQHALFGTVPEGTYDGGTVTPTLYPVEKIDWYTGGIQSIWATGTVAIITDVYTGISFRAQRLYGDAHADCEPLTTADTAAICAIYKVSNAQEISDREQELQSYKRRPLWVTIGGRTFAASMYGVPHNFAGDRIPDNNYNGQFCVHFVNSRVHRSNEVDKPSQANGYFSHQNAIDYAYSHSKSGTK